MTQVFVDTLYFMAVCNPGDQWHEAVVTSVDRLGDVVLVTTDEVLTEFLTGAAGMGRHLRMHAAAMVREFLGSEDTIVLPQSRETFLAGLDLYEKRADKGYSLTDCVSMNLMRSRGIDGVLTNDRHFSQEGFTVLVTR